MILYHIIAEHHAEHWLVVINIAYYTFNDGFGVVDASGEAVWDATSGKAVSETAPGLLDIGRTMLQTTYVDIGNR